MRLLIVVIDLFESDVHQNVSRKNGEAVRSKNLFPTTKCGDGSVIVLTCFTLKGVGNLEFIDKK